MRIGQNPAKFIEHAPQPQAVTVAVISYVPFLGGYYAQGLDLLKVCLESIWKNSDAPYDLMVFDNGSCQEVRQYLQAAQAGGKIQYLVLADKNVGKPAAWNFIFSAAPGEYVVYADQDVYFYPGWLSAQLKIMNEFPNIGMLTGMPVRNAEKYSTATVAWAESDPQASLERGALLPFEDFYRHTLSLGSSEAESRQNYAGGADILLHHRGQRYFVGAAHFQFMARSRVLREVLPIPARRPMGEVRLLDIAINERGYLRLSTPEWWVRHLGNSLQGEDLRLLDGAGQSQPNNQKAIPQRKKSKLWSWKPLRRIVQWVYNRSFDLLYRH